MANAEQTYTLNGPKQFFFPFPVQQKGQLTLTVMPDGTTVPEAEYDVAGAAPDAFSVTVTWLNAPVDGTQELIIARFTEVERVTDFVDDQAVPARALNAEFNNIYQILLELEGRISDLEDRMDAVEARLDDLEDRMDAVELRLDLVEADIAALYALIAALDVRVTSLEGRMAAAEARLDDAENRLDFVEDNLGTSTYQVNGVTQATSVRTVNLVDSNLLPGQFTVTQTGPNSAQVEVRPDVPAVSGTVALHVGALVTRAGGAPQVIPAGTPTPVNFSDIQYDDVEIYDAGQPTRLTAPVGTTRVQLTAALQFNSANAATLEIWKNGVPFPGGIASTENMFTAAAPAGRPGLISAVVDAVAGDYFEVVVTSALGQSVEPTGQTFFAMTLMQATGLLPAAGGALVSRTTDQVIAAPNTPVPVGFNNTVYDDATIVDGDGLRMPITLSADRCRLVGAVQVTNAEDIQIYVTKNSGNALAPNFIGAASFKRINHSEVGEDDFYTISSPILEVAPGDIFRVLVRSENNEEITIRGGNATWFSLELVGTPQPGFSPGGGDVEWQEDGTPVVTSATANFLTNFTVTDNGGVADIELGPDINVTGSGTFGGVISNAVLTNIPAHFKNTGTGFTRIAVTNSEGGAALQTDGNVSEIWHTDTDGVATTRALAATDGAGTEIYFNSALRFQTTSTGVAVTGDINGVNATMNYSVQGNQFMSASWSGTNTSVALQHNGSDVLVVDGATQSPRIITPAALSNGLHIVADSGSHSTTLAVSSTSTFMNTISNGVVQQIFQLSGGTLEVGQSGPNTKNFGRSSSGPINIGPFSSGPISIGSFASTGDVTLNSSTSVVASAANSVTMARGTNSVRVDNPGVTLTADFVDLRIPNDTNTASARLGLALAGTTYTVTLGEGMNGGEVDVAIASSNVGSNGVVRLGHFNATPVPQPVLTTGSQEELTAALGSTSGLGLVDDSAIATTPSAGTITRSSEWTWFTVTGNGLAVYGGATANGGAVSEAQSLPGNPVGGGIGLRTGSTDNASARVRTSHIIRLGLGRSRFRTDVSLSALSDATDEFEVAAGLQGGEFSSVTDDDELLFTYTHSVNSGNWRCVSQSAGGGQEITNTAVSPTVDTRQVLEVIINADATEAEFYIDGTLVATHTDIPTSAVPLRHGMVINKLAGTNARELQALGAGWDYVFDSPI